MNKVDLLANLERNNEFNDLSPLDWAQVLHKPFYKISKIICWIDGASCIYTPNELPGSDYYFFEGETFKINVNTFREFMGGGIQLNTYLDVCAESDDSFLYADIIDFNNGIVKCRATREWEYGREMPSLVELSDSDNVTIQLNFYYSGMWEA